MSAQKEEVWDNFKRSDKHYYTPDRMLGTFSVEPAVDSGGPKRQFLLVLFRFLLQMNTITCVFSSRCFCAGLRLISNRLRTMNNSGKIGVLTVN